MKFVTKILPLFLMAMLFAVPGFAQTGAIQGKVMDLEGKPMTGVLISIDRNQISQHFEVKTDSKGAYFHAGLPTGSYKVTVMQDGKPANFTDGVRVSFGGVANVDFDFRQLAAAAPPGMSAEDVAKAEAEKKAAEEVKTAFEAGLAAATAKNWAEAARLFGEAAAKDPTQPVIYGQLAGALSEARKYDEAVVAYRKAIELKPDDAAYYNNMGIALGNSGKIDEAIQALEKAAELNPSAAGQSYFNLGAVLTNRGRSKDAAEAFKKAIEVNPTMSQAYLQLGISYFGSPTTMGEAIPMLEKFLSMNPSAQDAETAKQLIEAAKAAAPTGFTSEGRTAAEKAAKEKAEKQKADEAAKAKAKKKGE